jgi:hypothetical protein
MPYFYYIEAFLIKAASLCIIRATILHNVQPNTNISKFLFLLPTREVSYVEILSVKNDWDILQHLHL